MNLNGHGRDVVIPLDRGRRGVVLLIAAQEYFLAVPRRRRTMSCIVATTVYKQARAVGAKW